MDEKRPDGGIDLHVSPQPAASSWPHPLWHQPDHTICDDELCCSHEGQHAPFLRSRAPSRHAACGGHCASWLLDVQACWNRPREISQGRDRLLDRGSANSCEHSLALHEIWPSAFPIFRWLIGLKIDGFAFTLIGQEELVMKTKL